MTSRTRANYEEATRLRDQDLSLAQIGERLGCSKQHVHKLLKSGKEASQSSTKASTTTSTDSVNQLTVRQRRFAKGLIEGKTHREAALEAAPPGKLTEGSADTWASRTLKSDRFRQGFQEVLAQNGLSLTDIARVHRENLAATRIAATSTQDGEITDALEVPDYPTRQRAVADGYRIHGKMKGDSTGEQPVNMKVVVLSQKDADMFRVFTGDGSLPETFQIAPEGVAEAVIEAEGATVDAPEEEVLP